MPLDEDYLLLPRSEEPGAPGQPSALRLIGSQVVLTGVRPDVARTLVGLGVDLGAVVTRGTLRSGITYAGGLRRAGGTGGG